MLQYFKNLLRFCWIGGVLGFLYGFLYVLVTSFFGPINDLFSFEYLFSVVTGLVLGGLFGITFSLFFGIFVAGWFSGVPVKILLIWGAFFTAIIPMVVFPVFLYFQHTELAFMWLFSAPPLGFVIGSVFISLKFSRYFRKDKSINDF